MSGDPLIGRTILTTSDEELAAEFGRLMMLFSRAYAQPSDRREFVGSVNAASSCGYSWVEALEFAAEERKRRE